MTKTAEWDQFKETDALAGSGVLLMLVGAASWAFDAIPSLGRVSLGVGVVALAAGLVLRRRLGATGRKLAMVFAALVFAFAVSELWLAIVTIAEHRSATLV